MWGEVCFTVPKRPLATTTQRYVTKDINIMNALKFQSKSLKEGKPGDKDADWKMVLNLVKIGGGGVG